MCWGQSASSATVVSAASGEEPVLFSATVWTVLTARAGVLVAAEAAVGARSTMPPMRKEASDWTLPSPLIRGAERRRSTATSSTRAEKVNRAQPPPEAGEDDEEEAAVVLFHQQAQPAGELGGLMTDGQEEVGGSGDEGQEQCQAEHGPQQGADGAQRGGGAGHGAQPPA